MSTLEDALRMFVERISANGEWDDGCFYYHGTSASELQEPLRLGAVALQALENGPAVLADATNDPASPSLSSLRKGAEIAVKPLEWVSHAWGAEADDGRYRIEDNGTNWTDDRYWLFVNVGLLTNHRSKYGTLDAAKAAAQSDFETRIRSALVSGSREDGADA